VDFQNQSLMAFDKTIQKNSTFIAFKILESAGFFFLLFFILLNAPLIFVIVVISSD
jgi:hypothetical protein